MKRLRAVAIYEVADDDNVAHEIECITAHLDNAVEVASVNVLSINVTTASGEPMATESEN